MNSTRSQAMGLIPVKNIEITEERLPDRGVIIRYPITLRPWIAKLFKRIGHNAGDQRTRRLQLDALGTEVWEMIDGIRSVLRISEIFAAKHQLDLREAEIAVTQFLRDLGRRGIIGLR